MPTVAVIGEHIRVHGFGLAGAAVHAAESADAVRAAWQALGNDVGVVILTPAAARALSDGPDLGLAGDRPAPARLTVVMPPWP